MTTDPNGHAPPTDDGPGLEDTSIDEHLGLDDDETGPSVDPSTAEAAVDGDEAESPEEFTPEMIDALVAERDEFLDAYRRTAADFENFRKQSQKRLADEVTRTQGSFVERLLPVLDAIDAARIQGNDHVEAVASALFGFLEKEGLERVHPADQAFDPNVAEAVVHEPGEHDELIVSEVLRTGYLWRGRVIRPAMVKVSG